MHSLIAPDNYREKLDVENVAISDVSAKLIDASHIIARIEMGNPTKAEYSIAIGLCRDGVAMWKLLESRLKKEKDRL